MTPSPRPTAHGPSRALAARPPFTSQVLSLVLLTVVVLALVAVALPAAGEGPAVGSALQDEVVADTFSVAELATAAHRVAPGGRLFLSGVDLGPGASAEALELERFRVFAPEARITVYGDDGETVLPPPDHAWFRGRVAGDAASLAVLSVREDGEVRGVVQRGGDMWVLGGEGRVDPRGPRSLAARQAAAAPPEGESFTCGQEELGPPPGLDLPGLGATSASAALTTTPYTVRVAVETDWEYYLKFGNVTDATAYVGDVFAYASAIYDAEIHTDLQVVDLKLRTSSSDPWSQTSTTCGLLEFGRYWNDNYSGVSRTIAHFMSGKGNGGGVAWVGALCNGPFNWDASGCPGLTPAVDNYGGGYGYSGDIDGNFDIDNPTTLWDWIVVAHEIGHNFNSPHTHCYNGIGGSSEPVDKCYGIQAGCYSGAASLPCGSPGAGCATIMSYCHFLSGGLGNIAPTFGTGHPYGTLPQRVPDRMRAHVEAVAGSGCVDRLGCYELTLGHTGTGSDPTALPTASPGCLAGQYNAGEVILLTGAPAVGWRVNGWSGTDDDGSTFLTNVLTMPVGNHGVTAAYAEGCTDLTLDSGTETGLQVYDACGQITAGTTYKVGSTGQVTLRSYQRVVLTDGFRVDSGGGLTVVVP